jgi:uncharacterized protein with beta-barrel porin domain
LILQDSAQIEDIWIYLKQNWPRGSFLLGDTGSGKWNTVDRQISI